jgi:SAM-dependent methyltransferase
VGGEVSELASEPGDRADARSAGRAERGRALSDRARQGLKFGPAAEDYEQGRPAWPVAAVARAAAGLGLAVDATVVDLAAGTGKLTRVLAGRFARVVAVEPLAPMREQLTARLPQVEVRPGTAERLPLEAGEADAVFVGDAFHWFDGRAALAELARVLTPAGGVALMWNLPAGPTEPPLPDRVRELIRAAIARGGEPGGPRLERGDWRAAFRASAFGELHHDQVSHETIRDREGVVANAMSISSVAGLPASERQALRTQLRTLIPEGTYRQPLYTDLYWAGLQPTVWCDRCGRALADGGHDDCAAARALEPPRFCPRCRRRMKVQVLPAGWIATCAEHGDIRGYPRDSIGT